jgi:peptidyl-prolyl cis-trans isomerase D
MIEKIRKPKKSRNILNYTMYAVIFGMIIATFVFMIPGLGDGGGAVNSAAEVGSKSISLREYTDQLRSTRDQYSKMFNGTIPPFFEQGLKRQVLEGLVKKEVLNQYAEKKSLIISDLEVGEFIKKEIPAFQEDGVFSYNRYSTYLTNTRNTPQKFESAIAKDLASRRLYNYLSSSLGKIEQEKVLEKKAAGIEVTFSYIELKEESLSKAIKASDSEVQAFMTSADNQKKIEAHYSQTMSKYVAPEQMGLKYILIKDEAKAKEVHATLTKENFGAVALEKSEDPLSKNKAGDLGFIERGSFSPEVEAKAFSMKSGELSKPFKTGLGYVILLAGEKKPKEQKKLKDVNLAVAKELYQKEKSQNLKRDFLELSKSGTAGQMASKLAEANLTWTKDQKFDLTANSLPGIGPSDEIMSKLFSLEQGKTHPNIVSFQDREFFIRLDSMAEKSVKADAKLAQNNSGGRGADLLDLVYENEKKAMNIELNQQIITQ